MKHILLFDNTFSPSPSTVAGHIPKNWKYTTNPNESWDFALYTHEQIFAPKTPQEKSYGLLFESPEIRRDIYGTVYKNIDFLKKHFKAIYTFHPDLLAMAPGFFLFAPAYGPWVGTDFGGHWPITNPKPGNVSCIASDKSFCVGHHIRKHIAKWAQHNGHAKCFGNAVGKPVEKVVEAIGPYKFSIVVENCVYENYFTEKLLNCFVCKTVPIYIGCPNIGKFFNPDGVIHIPSFNNYLTNLEKICEILRSETYNSEYERCIAGIEDNYQRVKEYACIEDWIDKKYHI